MDDRRFCFDDCDCDCCGILSCKLLEGVVLKSNCVVVMVVVVVVLGIEVAVNSLEGGERMRVG